jgi:4-amino-4-deoxy-L-arabinose transferase-like glycosyltransferase
VSVLGIALGARLLALAPFAAAPPVYDESYYLNVAEGIAQGRGHTLGMRPEWAPGALRPPLFSFLLAGALRVFGASQPLLRAFQIPLALLVVWLVFRIAARRYGTRAACAAGLFCALSPSLVHYSHFLWAEHLAAALLALFFFFVDRFDRAGRRRDLLAAGVALGLTALTKEVWVYFGAVAAAWCLWCARPRWRAAAPAAALLLLALLATVLPWTWRNQRVLGRFVLVSTNQWFPIAMGNLYDPERWLDPTPEDVRKAVIWRGKRLPRDQRPQFFRRVALGLIREQQPWWIGRKLVRTTVTMYHLGTEQLRFLARGWIQPGRLTARLLVVSDVLGHYAALIPGLLALWLVPGDRLKLLAVLAVLFLQAVHTLANAVPRFTVPLLPLYALYAGALVAGHAVRGPGRRWRLAAGLACVAALVLLPLPRSLAFLGKLWARVALLP